MTAIVSVDQTAAADLAAPVPNRAIRVLGPFAAGLALLSAFVTFVVLADLTPITPNHQVVVTLLLINALTVFLLLGIIAPKSGRWCRRGGAAAPRHDCTSGS